MFKMPTRVAGILLIFSSYAVAQPNNNTERQLRDKVAELQKNVREVKTKAERIKLKIEKAVWESDEYKALSDNLKKAENRLDMARRGGSQQEKMDASVELIKCKKELQTRPPELLEGALVASIEYQDAQKDVAKAEAQLQAPAKELAAIDEAVQKAKQDAAAAAEKKSPLHFEARAAEILDSKDREGVSVVRIIREPAIGKVFISTNLTRPKDMKDEGLNSQVYISLSEKGDFTFRIRITYGGSDWLFLRAILLRLDKNDTELVVPDTKHKADSASILAEVYGYTVTEVGDIEINEALLRNIIAAKKAYLTALGKDGRRSIEIHGEGIQSLQALIEYAEIIHQIGPVKAKALPKE